MSQWDVPRSAAGVRLLVEAGTHRGMTVDECLRGAALDPRALDDPTAEIATWQEVVIAHNLTAAHGDEPGLGLRIGLRLHLSSYGIAGLVLLSSPTLRYAFAAAGRFTGLMQSFSRVRPHQADGETALTLDASAAPRDVRTLLLERDLGTAVTACRELGAPWPPWRRVEITTPTPARTDVYREAFAMTPVFGTESTRLVFADDVLDAPLPQADPHALWLAERDCADLLTKRRARSTVTAQVLDRLWAAAPTMPNLDQVASALLTTRRTLGRRLAAEGTSFRALLDQVLRSVATDLLAARTLSVEQIADKLGYADTSAFTHAFRRWTGQSPRAYRAHESGASTALP